MVEMTAKSGIMVHFNKFNISATTTVTKKEVLDPIVKDLIGDKIWKQNKSKADLTVDYLLKGLCHGNFADFWPKVS